MELTKWIQESMTSDEEELKEPEGWAAFEREDLFHCAIPGIIVMLIVTYFADLGRGRAAGICAMLDVLVMKLRWTFKARIGFWLAISLILLGQVAFITQVLPPGYQWMSAYVLLPIALVVYLVEEGIVFLFTRTFRKRR